MGTDLVARDPFTEKCEPTKKILNASATYVRNLPEHITCHIMYRILVVWAPRNDKTPMAIRYLHPMRWIVRRNKFVQVSWIQIRSREKSRCKHQLLLTVRAMKDFRDQEKRIRSYAKLSDAECHHHA